MSLTILGLGTALPAQTVTQGRAAGLTSEVSGHTDDQARRLELLYGMAGINRRYLAILEHEALFRAATEVDGSRGPTTRWRMQQYDEHIRPLARRASGRALSASGIAPGEITQLVTVSCTGFAAPGFDIGLIKDLGLDPAVGRTHVGFMGCHGALNGLRVARAFAGSDPKARVLVCAAELCSLHFRFGWNADLAVTNALFADGAAAVVGANEPGPWRVAASGSYLTPDTDDAMTWTIGDHGFEMTLNPRVSHHIGEHLRPWLRGWLAGHGLEIGKVASWAIHPGGPRVLDGVAGALGLDRAATDVSREVLADHGNMSSPTVLFILERLRERPDSLPCVALAFGPGLTIEAALFV